jgi:hypothetical protein
MRKLLVLFVFTAAASACGGKSSSSNGGGTTPLSGTIGGRTFTPSDVKAIVAGSGTTPCPVPITGLGTVPVGIKAFALQITSYANACGDFATATCQFHQSAETVTLLFAKLTPPSLANPNPAEPTLTPGTYTVYASLTTANPDTSGNLIVTVAQAIATDATCNSGTPTPAPSASGTLRLDQVTGPITGHLSVTFTGGGSLEGDFSAPLCTGPSPDVCALATAGELCAVPGTCVP